MIIEKEDIYACCSLFILFRANIMLIKIHPCYLLAMKVDAIVKNNLDSYGNINADSHFCKSCYTILVKKKISKFEFANRINNSLIQK